MSRHHNRELSINQLPNPLPSLPLEELPSSSPKEPQLPPYYDVEPTGTATPTTQPQLPPPPNYSPMHDYLCSHQPPNPSITCPPSYITHPHQRTNSNPQSHPSTPAPPFLSTIGTPPPPSYEEVYIQHQEYMQRLIREFDENGSPSERSEEIFKWFVAVVVIGIVVFGVGVGTGWGGGWCGWVGVC